MWDAVSYVLLDRRKCLKRQDWDVLSGYYWTTRCSWNNLSRTCSDFS